MAKGKGKVKGDERKWFEVTVSETYTRTFRVLALDETDATECIENAFNEDNATCDEGEYDYTREETQVTEVEKGEYISTRESEGYFESVRS